MRRAVFCKGDYTVYEHFEQYANTVYKEDSSPVKAIFCNMTAVVQSVSMLGVNNIMFYFIVAIKMNTGIIF